MTTPFQSPSTRQGRAYGSATRENRKNLFQGSSHHGNATTAVGSARKMKKSGAASSSQSTASEAQSIQQSLQRTQNLLKNELDRVSQVSTAIVEDGKLLEDTKKTHQELNVSGAQHALTSLQRAQQQEQSVFNASCLFFFTVVFYILWCRIFIKLPFVERIVHLVLGWTHQVLGGTVGYAMEMVGQTVEMGTEIIQQIVEIATGKIQQIMA